MSHFKSSLIKHLFPLLGSGYGWYFCGTCGMKFLPKTVDINNRKRKRNNLPVGICAAFSLSGVKFKILTGCAVGS